MPQKDSNWIRKTLLTRDLLTRWVMCLEKSVLNRSWIFYEKKRRLTFCCWFLASRKKKWNWIYWEVFDIFGWPNPLFLLLLRDRCRNLHDVTSGERKIVNGKKSRFSFRILSIKLIFPAEVSRVPTFTSRVTISPEKSPASAMCCLEKAARLICPRKTFYSW